MNNIRDGLVKAGWRDKGKVLAHGVCWYGDGNSHKMNNYLSTDPLAVADKITLMQESGIDGYLADWFGVTANTFVHTAVMEMSQQCAERGLLFGLMLDPWVSNNTSDKTKAVITSLQHPDTQKMLSNRNYFRPSFVFDFGTGADTAAVSKATGLFLLQRHIHYSWPEKTSTIANLISDNSKLSMQYPGVCLRFNNGNVKDRNKNTFDINNPATIISDQGGNLYLDCVKYSNLATGAQDICLVTLDDYEEETAIEPQLAAQLGIRIGSR